MDLFFRTFLPAAAEAGLATPIMSRHLPVFRRCVAPDDATVLVNRCTRPDAPVPGDYLLLLTNHRLVVTRQSGLLHRLSLHLNTELRHLNNVTWSPDLRLSAVELAATAVDGIRERYLIRTGQLQQVRQLDALLGHVFRTPVPAYPGAPARPGRPAASAHPIPSVHPDRVGTGPAVAAKESRRPTFSPAVAV
jgi:hypothetical protein